MTINSEQDAKKYIAGRIATEMSSDLDEPISKITDWLLNRIQLLKQNYNEDSETEIYMYWIKDTENVAVVITWYGDLLYFNADTNCSMAAEILKKIQDGDLLTIQAYALAYRWLQPARLKRMIQQFA